jgi:hypothetical protein
VVRQGKHWACRGLTVAAHQGCVRAVSGGCGQPGMPRAAHLEAPLQQGGQAGGATQQDAAPAARERGGPGAAEAFLWGLELVVHVSF